MPTSTPSAATLDLALHTHLRQGLIVETLGELLDLAQAADLPRDLPIETIVSGRLLARYCPEIDAADWLPGSGYHTHLDLTGIDDADPDDGDRPTVTEILNAARQIAQPNPPTRLYLDLVATGGGQFLVATDGAGWESVRSVDARSDARQMSLAAIAAWLDSHPGRALLVTSDYALAWSDTYSPAVTFQRVVPGGWPLSIERRMRALASTAALMGTGQEAA